jgi:hypothetical protein
MSNPARTELHAFSVEVKRVLDMQYDYFRGRKNQSLPQISLREMKKAEKQLLGLINMINMDNSAVNQSNLFEPVHTMPAKKGLTTPSELAGMYGKEVSLEWLNNDGTAWIPTKGKVNAITIRHAEMERVRNLTPSAIPPSPVGHSPKGETGTAQPEFPRSDGHLGGVKEVSYE